MLHAVQVYKLDPMEFEKMFISHIKKSSCQSSFPLPQNCFVVFCIVRFSERGRKHLTTCISSLEHKHHKHGWTALAPYTPYILHKNA